MDAKEEVRSRISIVDVIGEYVQLKRAGRSYKGISPFTQEKTPSFFVSPEKQIWHCFSTNKGGDVYSFIMEVEGLDFKGALELLARKAGVDLSQFQKGDGTYAKKKERLLQAVQLAERYFQQAMIKSPVAIDYIFKQRGLSREAAGAFGIGYATESYEALTGLLLKRGYTRSELLDAGLAAQRRTLSDLFRGRMMIPLRDPQGRTLGFTGRLIADVKNAPKYLNTPQTILYDKSRHVFGLELAKEAIRLNDYAVLVEGNLDVVSSHQAGVKQVVATAGTALTEQHLRTLLRFTPNLRLCFDADKAGIAATERAIPLAQAVGAELSIVTLPAGAKDPDELIKSDVEAWRQAIEQPRDVVEWVIDEYIRRIGIDSAEAKAKTSSKAIDLIGRINDPVKIEHYIAYLSAALGVSVAALQAKLEGATHNEAPPVRKEVKATPSGPDSFAYQDVLLGLGAAHPEVRDTLRRLEPSDMAGEHRQKMLGVLLSMANRRLDDEMIAAMPDLREIETYVKIILFKAEERYGGPKWSSTDLYHEAAALATKVTKDKRERKLKEISEAIRVAHDSGDVSELAALTKTYQQLRMENK